MLTINDIAAATSAKEHSHRNHQQSNMEKTYDSMFFAKLLIHLYMLYLAMKLFKTEVKFCKSLMVKLMLLVIASWTSANMSHQSYNYDFIILTLSLLLVHQSLRIPVLDVNNKAVLITGCDRGFGHALAIKLDQLGFKVFAGCLFKGGEGAESLLKTCSNRLQVLQLDVSDPTQIDNAYNTVTYSLEDYILWGLVNNAGVCYIGNSEMISTEDSLKLMDINFRGPFLLCRKFLPLLRRSQGRIVNVSSNAGLAPIPLMGAYCCSKSALFMLSEVLRAENKHWGVKVSTIVPSGYKTGIIAYDKMKMAEKWFAEAPEIVKEDFGKEAFIIKSKAGDSDEMLSADISPVINAMVDGLLSSNPQPVYYKGFLSRLIPFMYMHMPSPIRGPVMSVIADWFEFQPSCLQNDEDSKEDIKVVL